MIVHSDKKRKPRYWVTEKGKTVFETKSGSAAIQWAINKTDDGCIELPSPIDLDYSVRGKGSTIYMKGKKK